MSGFTPVNAGDTGPDVKREKEMDVDMHMNLNDQNMNTASAPLDTNMRMNVNTLPPSAYASASVPVSATEHPERGGGETGRATHTQTATATDSGTTSAGIANGAAAATAPRHDLEFGHANNSHGINDNSHNDSYHAHDQSGGHASESASFLTTSQEGHQPHQQRQQIPTTAFQTSQERAAAALKHALGSAAPPPLPSSSSQQPFNPHNAATATSSNMPHHPAPNPDHPPTSSPPPPTTATTVPTSTISASSALPAGTTAIATEQASAFDYGAPAFTPTTGTNTAAAPDPAADAKPNANANADASTPPIPAPVPLSAPTSAPAPAPTQAHANDDTEADPEMHMHPRKQRKTGADTKVPVNEEQRTNHIAGSGAAGSTNPLITSQGNVSEGLLEAGRVGKESQVGGGNQNGAGVDAVRDAKVDVSVNEPESATAPTSAPAPQPSLPAVPSTKPALAAATDNRTGGATGSGSGRVGLTATPAAGFSALQQFFPTNTAFAAEQSQPTHTPASKDSAQPQPSAGNKAISTSAMSGFAALGGPEQAQIQPRTRAHATRTQGAADTFQDEQREGETPQDHQTLAGQDQSKDTQLQPQPPQFQQNAGAQGDAATATATNTRVHDEPPPASSTRSRARKSTGQSPPLFTRFVTPGKTTRGSAGSVLSPPGPASAGQTQSQPHPTFAGSPPPPPGVSTRASTRGRPGYETLVSFAQLNGTGTAGSPFSGGLPYVAAPSSQQSATHQQQQPNFGHFGASVAAPTTPGTTTSRRSSGQSHYNTRAHDHGREAGTDAERAPPSATHFNLRHPYVQNPNPHNHQYAPRGDINSEVAAHTPIPPNVPPTRYPPTKLVEVLCNAIARAEAAGESRVAGSLLWIKEHAATEPALFGIVDGALGARHGSKERSVFKKVVRRAIRRAQQAAAAAAAAVAAEGRASPPKKRGRRGGRRSEATKEKERREREKATNRGRETAAEAEEAEAEAEAGVAAAVDAAEAQEEPQVEEGTAPATAAAEDVTPAAVETRATRRRTRRRASDRSHPASSASAGEVTTTITRTQSAASDHSSTSSLSSAKSVDLGVTETAADKPAGPVLVPENAAAAADSTIAGVAPAAPGTAAAGPAKVAAAAPTSRKAQARATAAATAAVAKRQRRQRQQAPYTQRPGGLSSRPTFSAALKRRMEDDPDFSDDVLAEKRARLKQELPPYAPERSEVRTPANGTIPVKETAEGWGRGSGRRRRAEAEIRGPETHMMRRRREELELEEQELMAIESPVDISSSEEEESAAEDEGIGSAVVSDAGSGGKAGRAAKAKARESSRVVALAKMRTRNQGAAAQSVKEADKAGLRIKRKNGTTFVSSTAPAGVSTRSRNTRASANGSARPSTEPTTAATSSEIEAEQDNLDYCIACGGSGSLLCCDGCVNSFHFTCLEPPMDPANPPEGQWFCSECEGKMQGHGLKAMAKTAASLGANQTEGPLGSLVSTAETLPQRSFQLPNGVRDYYTGVQTGKQGEYAPVAVLPRREVRTVARGTTNDERNSMHLYALQDNKGKFIFCVACGRSSLGNKPILVCDYCPCAWHLDCLPFPVANPPTQKLTSDKVYHHWKCPNHIEHDLKYIRRFGGRNGHIRRPRNPRFIDIDVIPSSSEEFNADFQAAAATAGAALGPGNGMGAGRVFDDVEQDGTVYRISERGLILDFIRRVKREKCMETSMREFYRACVAREDPEWIRQELLNAPKDVLREVVGDETDYLPDDPARKGLQARVRSTTQSNAAANVVPSTSENDAALGLLAMANTAALPGTAAPAAPTTAAAVADNAAVERLSGLVEKLLVATDRQDPNRGSTANDARVQPGPAPAESEAPSSNSDKPSSRKVILRFPRSVNIGQEQPRPSSAGSMSSAETTNTPGGTRRTRRSARHEREQQQQAERPEAVPEPTAATAEGEESSERREDPETEAAGANRILPNAANELELLRSIQELVSERMKALGGDSSTALPTSTE